MGEGGAIRSPSFVGASGPDVAARLLPALPLRRAWTRRRSHGMTLIEVLIVMALIALILCAVVIGSGQMSSSRLRHSSTMLTGAIRVAFSRATASSKTVRLVMDFDDNAIWLEEGDQPHLVQPKDKTGTGGAAAATVIEKQALEDSSRILKGPTAPRTAFTEIDAMGLVASEPGKGHKPLERGIKFRQVQTAHDYEPRKEGRAYLYFWPGGQTERAAIQLKVGDNDEEANAVTLIVAPLTGKVTIKDGAVDLPEPQDDNEASEREDPGAF
ncbi:MAG: prepilin-type N-terminal cleavage/methylation domain-containing protein [Labilithrix sp.]|nr:prepilin-type N-terminal cleavage/methylation domain-containing protein [Labilithrix sp.]